MRKIKIDDVLNFIADYLHQNEWKTCHKTVLYIDPVTKALYSGDVAFAIQIGRDLKS